MNNLTRIEKIKKAFTLCITIHHRDFAKLVAKLYVVQKGAREDILQTAYKNAYRSITKDREEEVENYKAYIITVIKNTVIEYWKKNNTHAPFDELTDDITNELRVIQDEEMFDKILEHYKTLDVIVGIEGRELLERHYLDKVKIKDLALEMNCTESIVNNKLYQLREKLRKHFQIKKGK